MNTRYYYIPKIYEAQLSQAIEVWKYGSPNAFVVVTGQYNNIEVQEIGEITYTGIEDMTGALIPSTQYFQNLNFQLIKMELQAFCLKGELPQDVHQLAISLDGVKCFDSPESYLEFIDELI